MTRCHCWNTFLLNNGSIVYLKKSYSAMASDHVNGIMTEEAKKKLITLVQKWSTWCGAKNTFGMSVFSKQYAFLDLFLWDPCQYFLLSNSDVSVRIFCLDCCIKSFLRSVLHVLIISSYSSIYRNNDINRIIHAVNYSLYTLLHSNIILYLLRPSVFAGCR
jgi:hypothetical protein